jgi:predicted secreted protein
MRPKLFFRLHTLALLVLALGLPASSASAQNPASAQPPSPAEQEVMNKMLAAGQANDFTALLAAASEYVKKFSKSTWRPEVARRVAMKIGEKKESADYISLAENFLTIFTEPREAALIQPSLIDAYNRANRFDDGFKVGATYLEKNPEDVVVLTNLALIGVDQAKRQNPKFVQQSAQYATKAVALIEADKLPASMSPELKSEFKTRWLGQLYQSLGLISYMNQNREEARANMEKAAAADATDPFVFAMLGSIVNDEYQQLAQQHKTMAAGPQKDELLKQAYAKIDQVIELFARSVALATNRPEYKPLHDQIRQDLEVYYRFRHNNSTEGLQELIDKYKKP